MNYKGKKILIVGLGKSGLAAVHYLATKDAELVVTDTLNKAELSAELALLKSYNIEYHLGSNPTELFSSCDLVVLSPGVPVTIDGVNVAKENGIPVVCEMELGLEEVKGNIIANL